LGPLRNSSVPQAGYGLATDIYLIVVPEISFKPQKNKTFLAAHVKFMWSIWPFVLSELCRPGLR